MALTRIIGNDGGITLPGGTHDGAISRHSTQYPRVATNVTQFSDTVEHNRLGLMSITGNASGAPTFDAASSQPGISDRVAGGSALTLTYATGCTVAITAAMQNITLGSEKQGDAALQFDFVNGDSDTVTVTWDES